LEQREEAAQSRGRRVLSKPVFPSVLLQSVTALLWSHWAFKRRLCPWPVSMSFEQPYLIKQPLSKVIRSYNLSPFKKKRVQGGVWQGCFQTGLFKKSCDSAGFIGLTIVAVVCCCKGEMNYLWGTKNIKYTFSFRFSPLHCHNHEPLCLCACSKPCWRGMCVDVLDISRLAWVSWINVSIYASDCCKHHIFSCSGKQPKFFFSISKWICMSRVSGGWDADEIILSAPNLYSGKPKSLVTVLEQNQRVCMIRSSGT